MLRYVIMCHIIYIDEFYRSLKELQEINLVFEIFIFISFED